MTSNSYFFRLCGPSMNMDSACSSSFVAIQTACSHLWRGDIDTAVAGGTNVLTTPDKWAGLDRGHFLSTTSMYNLLLTDLTHSLTSFWRQLQHV